MRYVIELDCSSESCINKDGKECRHLWHLIGRCELFMGYPTKDPLRGPLRLPRCIEVAEVEEVHDV